MALGLSLLTALSCCHGSSATAHYGAGATIGNAQAKSLSLRARETSAAGKGTGAWLGQGKDPETAPVLVSGTKGKTGSVPQRNEAEAEVKLSGIRSWFPGEALESLVDESGPAWGPRGRLLAARMPAACPKRCTKTCSPGNCAAITCCASQMGAARCADYVAAAAACQKRKGRKSPGCQQATALYNIVGSTQVLLNREVRSCPSLKAYATFYGLLRSWIVGLRARCC